MGCVIVIVCHGWQPLPYVYSPTLLKMFFRIFLSHVPVFSRFVYKFLETSSKYWRNFNWKFLNFFLKFSENFIWNLCKFYIIFAQIFLSLHSKLYFFFHLFVNCFILFTIIIKKIFISMNLKNFFCYLTQNFNRFFQFPRSYWKFQQIFSNFFFLCKSYSYNYEKLFNFTRNVI